MDCSSRSTTRNLKTPAAVGGASAVGSREVVDRKRGTVDPRLVREWRWDCGPSSFAHRLHACCVRSIRLLPGTQIPVRLCSGAWRTHQPDRRASLTHRSRGQCTGELKPYGVPYGWRGMRDGSARRLRTTGWLQRNAKETRLEGPGISQHDCACMAPVGMKAHCYD